MTDHVDPTELASAYLDDQLDPAERARVESDASLMAEVDELREVQALVGHVEPAPISRREEQFAAALGIWDRLPEAERSGAARENRPEGVSAAAAVGAGALTRTTPAKTERWFRSPRLLGAAAAVIIVLGGLAVVLRQNPGDDDSPVAEEPAEADEADDAESASAAADEAADGAADEADDAGGDAAADSAEAASEEGEEAAATVEAIETTSPEARELAADDLEAEADALEEAEEQGVDVRNATPSADVDELGPPAEFDTSELTLISDDEDLADFASLAAIAPESATDVTTPFEECRGLGIDVVVGPAAYVGYGPVLVGVDLSRDAAIAYDAETCQVVATASLS